MTTQSQSFNTIDSNNVMEFVCRRCGYVSKDKSNYIRHLKRKHVCIASLEDVSTSILLEEIQGSKDGTQDQKVYECHCGKTFTDRSNRHRHMKTCNAIINNDEQQDQIKSLQEKMVFMEQELARLKGQSGSSTTNNNTTNNNTNNGTINNINIQIRNFGHEKIDHLPSEFITDCFRNQDIPKLIETLLFDRERPENRTVRIKSLKNKQIQVHQDGGWTTRAADTVLEQLVNKGSTILNTHYKKNRDECEGELSTEELDEVLHWLKEEVENNPKIRKPIKIELLNMLDNYRHGLKFVDG